MFSSLYRQLIAATFLAITAPTFGQQSAEATPSDSDQPIDKPVLRLNVSTDGYPPYLIVTRDHEYGGIAYDVITRIAERMKYQVEPLEIPRKRVDSLLRKGIIDATPRAREWTENPGEFLFSDTIVPVQEVFFSTLESNFRYAGLDTLKGSTVATPLGYQYPQLEPLFEDGRLERFEVSRDRDVFTFLLHGRGIDAGIADLAVGQWIIRQQNWQGKFRHSDKTITDIGYRLMVRPEWTGFTEEFNQHLADMKASGELENILNQYR